MKFAEFLYTLRKEKRLTQSELAEKLGVTNKAVSKWETGESYPETAQLVPLAAILGVTVDELLKGERAKAKTCEASDKKETDDGDEEDSDDEKDEDAGKSAEDDVKHDGEKRINVNGFVSTLIMLTSVAAYLVLGLIFNKWHPGWVVFPVAIIICGIFDEIHVIVKNVRSGKRGKSSHAVCGLIMMVASVTYLVIGFAFNMWHPGWTIFLVACFVCILFDLIYKFICNK